MKNLMNGLNYNEYIDKLNDEHKLQLIKSYEDITLSQNTKTFFSDFPEEVKVVIFSEGYCPDCSLIIPFIRKIQECNSKVSISILSRDENVDLLEECSGEARIPTIMTFKKDMEPIGLYVEFPKEFKDSMKNLNENNRIELIKQFREGKYNDIIEKDIMKLFIRKD